MKFTPPPPQHNVFRKSHKTFWVLQDLERIIRSGPQVHCDCRRHSGALNSHKKRVIWGGGAVFFLEFFKVIRVRKRFYVGIIMGVIQLLGRSISRRSYHVATKLSLVHTKHTKQFSRFFWLQDDPPPPSEGITTDQGISLKIPPLKVPLPLLNPARSAGKFFC